MKKTIEICDFCHKNEAEKDAYVKFEMLWVYEGDDTVPVKCCKNCQDAINSLRVEE